MVLVLHKNAVADAAKRTCRYKLCFDWRCDQRSKKMFKVLLSWITKQHTLQVWLQLKLKTKQVGFVGGMESEVISRFAAGFKAGVESVDPSYQSTSETTLVHLVMLLKVNNCCSSIRRCRCYLPSSWWYGACSSEAKSLNESKKWKWKVWVIGVDRDQVDEGKYTSKDGKEANFVLASTLKQVGTAVKDLANKAEKGEFPGGQVIVYSLKDKGVDLAVTNLLKKGKKAVECKAKILDGSIKVPEK